MSHFPKMFVSPPEGFNTYLLQISQHGMGVIYSMGKDGLPVGMVAGQLTDILGEPIKNCFPNYRLVRMVHSMPPKIFAQPSDFGLWPPHDNWASLSKVLNGKGIGTGQFREQLYTFRRYEFPIPYIGDDGDSWVLTNDGLASDSHHAEKIERSLAAAKNGEGKP